MVAPIKIDDGQVSLPCTPDTFKQFVSGLLGSAQTIERSFAGTFELEHSEINNIFQLVNQRVTQQNESSLLEFTIKLIYNDKSSVLLNSLSEFEHYREVRPIASSCAHLSWV